MSFGRTEFKSCEQREFRPEGELEKRKIDSQKLWG
jgi:hypothetical protein